MGVRNTHEPAPGCLYTSQTDESGSGGYLYTGDPFTDDIHRHFGHVNRSKVHIGLFSNYETTTTRTQTGSGQFPCEDHTTVDGPDDSLDVIGIDFVEVSRTSGSITYKVDAWEGAYGETSDWNDIAGRLVLSEVR